jgi:hypothetical protein
MRRTGSCRQAATQEPRTVCNVVLASVRDGLFALDDVGIVEGHGGHFGQLAGGATSVARLRPRLRSTPSAIAFQGQHMLRRAQFDGNLGHAVDDAGRFVLGDGQAAALS